MLLDELDTPLDDVVVVDRLAIADYNESNILPQDEATLTRLRAWIRPTKYEGDGSELKKHTSSHLKGTSQWLLGSPIFQQWHNGGEDGILWIRGVPGTGKSVLASTLIHHLSSEECPVLHFFFRHTIQSNHRPESALRDWLAQVLPFSPPLQLALVNLTSDPINVDFVDDLSLVELWHLVRLALKSMPKAYCVVDALDEMDNHALEHFLPLIDQLGNMHPDQVKLIITSRPIATTEKMVRNLRLLDIRLDKKSVNPDISAYLQHRLAGSKLSPETKDAIRDAVFKKADGLFLYAKLTMDKVTGLENEAETKILETLDRMPVDLSVMYGHLLREHVGRSGLPGGLHMLVLQLVTHATRPLRLLEISDCIKVTQPQYDQDIGGIKSLVRTCCGSLLEVLPDETVRVVHHSLTEYLLGLTRPSDDHDIPVFEPGLTHNLMANVCLLYLQSGCIDTLEFKESRNSDRRPSLKPQEFPPFMNYALTNWHIHTARSARQGFPQEETNDRIFSLLMTAEYLGRLSALGKETQRMNCEEMFPAPKMSFETEMLLFSLRYGLTDFIGSFLERRDGGLVKCDGCLDVDLVFHQAVEKGNLDIVQLLIKSGAKLDKHGKGGDTPLHLALGQTYTTARHYRTNRPPHPAIVERLLEAGADPFKARTDGNTPMRRMTRTRDRDLRQDPNTPIKKAFSDCDETIVKLFISYIKTEEDANKALRWVVDGSRNTEVLRLILTLGLADINAHADGPTPLFLACKQVDPKAVSMLLAAGADPNVCHLRKSHSNFGDEMAGSNVLHALAVPNALRSSYEPRYEPVTNDAIRECFELVLSAGANVNHVNGGGNTPLHLVKHPLVAQLLLDAGADGSAMNCRDNTPLHISHSFNIMKTILSKTNMDIKDREGKTMLHMLSQGRFDHPQERELSLSGALQLLDLGADACVVDNDGNSALHYLATHERMTSPEGRELLERLMQGGLYPDLHNAKGVTAFHRLKFHSGHAQIQLAATLRTFIELTKADVNTVDSKGRTLLFRTLDEYYVDITDMGNDSNGFIPVMAEIGARFDVTDQRGRTLLHTTVRHIRNSKDVDILRLLIELGADPRQADHNGNTAWHDAVPRFVGWSVKPEVFDKITALGVDPKQANKLGKTPFHLVCEYERWASEDKATVFEYLLQQVIGDINCKDHGGATAIHAASTFSVDLTMRLLKAGADATAVTNEGLNVLHLAARCRQSNTIGLLLDWFRERKDQQELYRLLNLKDKRRRAPLYYACASGSFQSVDLLINAGAVVDMETYEGSALSGCVYIEEEKENWGGRHDESSCSDAGGLLVDDTKRPKKTRNEGRLQETLSLIIDNAAAPNWRLLDIAISTAVELEIATETKRQMSTKKGVPRYPDHDYTVECLLRARTSLGIQDELPCAPEAQLCIQRREKKLSNLYGEKTCKCGRCYSFPTRIEDFMSSKCYGAIPDYIAKASLKPEGLHRLLVTLAKSGFERLLDTLLTAEAISSLQSTDDKSMASLLCAACKSYEPNMPVIKLLVSRGAHLDDVKTPDDSFLHILFQCDRPSSPPWWHRSQALPYLLEQGVDLEVRGKNGLTPLNANLANMDEPYWSSKVTEVLLHAGADPNSVDDRGKSCLARAVGDKAVFGMLVQHGAIIDRTGLISAIRAKDVQLVEMMLASGADPNAPHVIDLSKLGRYGCSSWDKLHPLDLVINDMDWKTQGEVCIPMVEVLLKFGADPNARFHDTTVAHRAIKKQGSSGRAEHSRRSDCLDTFLRHPSLDVNLRDFAGAPLLHAALEVGDEKAARTLIERGADIRLRDNFDRNILHTKSPLLSKKSFFDDILALAPELPHQADKYGRTPLHCALGCRDRYGRLDTLEGFEIFVEMLIAAGVDVCAKTANGDTPIHFLFLATWELLVDDGDVQVWQGPVKKTMELLLFKGVDINARNEAGETPIFSYFREGDFDVETTKAYFKRHKRPSRKRFALFLGSSDVQRRAIEKTEPMLWALLEKAGVEWTAVNAKGQSLLHVVVGRDDRCSRRLARFEFLLSKGLDPLMEDREHRTALDIAAAKNVDDILDLFKTE